MTKKVLPLIMLFLIFFVSGCTSKQQTTNLYDEILKRDKLIVGVKTDSKPFGYIEPDTLEISGIDVDIAKRLASDFLGDESKLTLIPVNPDKRIQSVTSGKVDIVIATMSMTPERQQVVDFSTPYYLAGQSALVKNDSDINTYSDLNNKRVAIVLGTTAANNVKKHIPNAMITGYKDYNEAFNALQTGKADALSSDDAILMGFITNEEEYKLLNPRLTIETYGIAIKKGSDTVSLKYAVNRSLQEMKTDGYLEKIKHRYITY